MEWTYRIDRHSLKWATSNKQKSLALIRVCVVVVQLTSYTLLNKIFDILVHALPYKPVGP